VRKSFNVVEYRLELMELEEKGWRVRAVEYFYSFFRVKETEKEDE
jgi:hypothetical protein